jgi:mono/diheme cytochrome c family protein
MVMANFLFSILFFLPLVLHAQARTVQKKAVVKKVAKPASPLPADGKALYQKHCLVCHQLDGSGVGTLNPPLVTQYVSGDKNKLIRMILKGSKGTIEIDGDTFSNTMPAQPYLTDAQIAAVLTYVRSNFGNSAGPVTPAQVRAVRAKTK